ncbi:MAG: hypothetical protein ACKOPT_10295, partial [Cyanobium sp.]
FSAVPQVACPASSSRRQQQPPLSAVLPLVLEHRPLADACSRWLRGKARLKRHSKPGRLCMRPASTKVG